MSPLKAQWTFLINLDICEKDRHLRADVTKYRPEVYKSEKSKILKNIYKVALR